MILTDYVQIVISRKNIDYFSLYYKDIKLKDKIKVKPEELQTGSNSFIDVKCDICGLERNIKYQAYYKNINSCEDYPIYTCDKCSHLKIKSHNRKKWGVDYFSQTDDYKIKFKSTMLERWGVEHALQSNYFKEKLKKTNIERFGVENPFMDVIMIRDKFKDKWGVDHPSKVKSIKDKIENTKIINDTSLSSTEIKNKIKRTNNLRYNGHPMKNLNITNKVKETNLRKYGVEYNLQSDICREKIKETCLGKWFVDNPMKSDEIRSRFIISNDKDYIKYLGESYSLFFCEKGHEFSINIDNYHSRKKSKTKICTVCNPIGSSSSIKELELFEFIKSIYLGEIIQSYRDGLEIDIYLPDLRIGFEFNGLYWHSEKYKDKWYHINKTNHFLDRGIKIIHIWEDDWDYKRSILESQIRNWLGLTKNKIFARQCEVREITKPSESTKFLNVNHIQGRSNSNLKLGLYYNGELVSLMTFDHFEGRKKMVDNEWNINRFCNKLDTIVVGGSSKLLNFFIKTYSPKRIISYADKDWSIGNLYETLGFKMVSETKPDYKYILDGRRIHKSRYRKSFTGISESDLNIFKVFDCGKIKFEKIIN